MQNPKGLGVDQNRLFVCDGIAGLKIYDLEEPSYPELINTEVDIDCYDVIAVNGLLVISDDSGLLQYSYNQVDPEVSPLSVILIEEEILQEEL